MYFIDNFLLPENQPLLMITAALYSPMSLPLDTATPENVPASCKEQTQAAADCYNAGAILLGFHVGDPKTDQTSKDFKEYCDQIARDGEIVARRFRLMDLSSANRRKR